MLGGPTICPSTGEGQGSSSGGGMCIAVIEGAIESSGEPEEVPRRIRYGVL
jgi:hypothetical protein